MGAEENAVITVRLDLKNRYSVIMEETQMDSSELMEHFFSLYNSNVEKVWTESDGSKQAKQQGLHKETKYWMRKVLSRPDHDKLFPKSHDPDNGADNIDTETATSKECDVSGTEDKLGPSDRDIETIPALQVGRKRKCPRKIILTLPEHILSKDISINVSNRLGQASKSAKKTFESKTKAADVSSSTVCSSTVTSETAKPTEEEEEEEEEQVMPEGSPLTPNIKIEPEGSGDEAENTDSATPATKESSPELEGEKSQEGQNQIDDEGVADGEAEEDTSMNCNYLGPGEEEEEEGESLEMSVEEIGDSDNYQIGLNEGENVKFVRDVALSIAKDMAVTENGETVFNCNFCSYKTNVLGRLRRHITVHTGKEFKCPYCSKAYTEKCKLTEHIKVKHEKSVSYPCPKCSKVFTSKRGLEYHNITFHEERGTTLKCSFCPKVFSSRFGFTYHTKTAHGESKIEENFKSTSDTLIPMSKWEKSTMKKETEKEFQKDNSGMYNCKLCEYKTPRMFHIRRHLGVHYGNTNKCEQCEKTFSDSYKLRLHVQVKHGNLRFDCDYCHRDFGTKEGLKYHRLSAHEGNWKYLCPDCGQGFYQKHHFEGHVNKHKGIKAYGCKTCGKKFFYQSDVSIHKKHCGQEKKPLEKPTTFVCHVCGDQFKKKSILIEHENGKHGRIGNYVCECGVSFKWRNSLRQHKQRCSTAAAISDYSVTDITDLSGASDFIAMQIKPELDSDVINTEAGDMEAMDTDDNQPDDISYSQQSPPEDDTESNTAAELENENDDQVYVVKAEPTENAVFQHGAMLTPPGVATDALYEMPASQVSDQEGNDSDFVIYPDDSSTSSFDDKSSGEDHSDTEEETDAWFDYSSKSNKNLKRRLSLMESRNEPSGKQFRCPRCGKVFRVRNAFLKHRSICHRKAVIRRSVIEMYVCGFCDGRFSNKAHFKEHSKTHQRKMRKKTKMQQSFRKKAKEQLLNIEQSKSTLENSHEENVETHFQTDMVFDIPVDHSVENGMESDSEAQVTCMLQDESISSGNIDHTLVSNPVTPEETPATLNVRHTNDSGHCDEQPQRVQSGPVEHVQDLDHTHNNRSTKTPVESCNMSKHSDQGKDFPFVNVAVVDLSNAQNYPNKDVDSGWDLSIKPNHSGLMQEKERKKSESASSLQVEEGQRNNLSAEFQNSFTCEICGATIDDHEKYINHISLHAVTRIQMFQEQQNNSNKDLNTCGSESGSLQTSNWNTMEAEKNNFTCNICGDVFLKRSYLKEHILGMHGNVNRYSCVCGERFKWRSSLNLHKEKCPSSPSRNISNGQKHLPINRPPINRPNSSTAYSFKIGSKRKSPASRSSLPLPPISSSLSPRMLPGISPHFMDTRTSSVLGMIPPHISQTTSYTPVMETHVQAGEMYLHSVPVSATSTENKLPEQQTHGHFPSLSYERSPPRSGNNVQRKSSDNGLPSQSVVPTGMFRSNGSTDFSFQVPVSKEQGIPQQWSSSSTSDIIQSQQQQETEKVIGNEIRIKQEVISFDEEPDTRIEMNETVINQLMLAAAEPAGNVDVPKTEPYLVSNTRPEHQIKHEQSSYSCSICKKYFRTQIAYTDHMNKHRGIKPYPCTSCGMSFHYQSILSSHKKTCGVAGNNMYKCHICGDTFTVRGYLREHVLGKHGDARRYSCRCGATFKWRSSLGSHQKKCPLTGKSYM
ncbi:uncharacterized protein LOC110462865 [Mizuhopecten yessoensis]|uniref:uncharacterized protein LOC110462865 n=1 Tax=Mizuhopecten yessoensis TaxID=6573 RepID=UPI000B45A235|nr:uncharacterized protein LOC110462865 [Mizuhopecten yessoensis]